MKSAIYFVVVAVAVAVALPVPQTSHNNGNPTGEIGAPAFDEIVVESTLTVRGKSGSRKTGKSLVNKPGEEVKTEEAAAVTLTRSKRHGRNRYSPYSQNSLHQPPRFPSSGSSSAQASSQAFNSNSPFGNFGASASQAGSQSFNIGPHGVQGSAGQSASQTYNLPNGSQVGVSFSSGYTINNGRPNFSNSQSVTLTKPNGQKQEIYE